MTATGNENQSLWNPASTYSGLDDPVYKTLSVSRCIQHEYDTYHIKLVLVNNTCGGMVAVTALTLIGKAIQIILTKVMGLINWYAKCIVDTLEMAMSMSGLHGYIDHNIIPGMSNVTKIMYL